MPFNPKNLSDKEREELEIIKKEIERIKIIMEERLKKLEEEIESLKITSLSSNPKP